MKCVKAWAQQELGQIKLDGIRTVWRTASSCGKIPLLFSEQPLDSLTNLST